MDEEPISVGNMLFTMVDPNRGHEVAYNRWYERDHFYAGCMIGPYLFAGRRWVAPRRLKDLRFPADSPVAEPVDAGSYLAIYWRLKGKEDEASAWSQPNVFWLYQNDRGFDERTHVHTSNYSFDAVQYASDDPVPLALALDHSYEGLAAVFVEPVGCSDEECRTWLAVNAIPKLLAGGSVATVASFSLPASRRNAPKQASPMPLGTDGGTDDRIIQLCFLEQEPESCWDDIRAYAATINAGGKGRVTFAAPFIPTDVGTDRYTDELWQ